MKRGLLLVLVAAAAAAAVLVMNPSRPRCSGFSFAHPRGDCVVWYARDGDRLLDMVRVWARIAHPRELRHPEDGDQDTGQHQQVPCVPHDLSPPDRCTQL